MILHIQINNKAPKGTALISGPRCYVDAAINPDGGGNPPRSAGIGIYIFHPSPWFQLFI